MDRETTDGLVLLWAKAYLDIMGVMADTFAVTAKTISAELQERAMMGEIEDHLRLMTH